MNAFPPAGGRLGWGLKQTCNVVSRFIAQGTITRNGTKSMMLRNPTLTLTLLPARGISDEYGSASARTVVKGRGRT